MSHPDHPKPHEHEEIEKSKLRTAHPEHTDPPYPPTTPK